MLFSPFLGYFGPSLGLEKRVFDQNGPKIDFSKMIFYPTFGQFWVILDPKGVDGDLPQRLGGYRRDNF